MDAKIKAFRQKVFERVKKEYGPEQKRIKEIIYEYIASKNRIVCGTKAIRMLLKQHVSHLPPYPDPRDKLPTFYSPDSMTDAKEIIRLLGTDDMLKKSVYDYFAKKESNYNISTNCTPLGKLFIIRYYPAGFENLEYETLPSGLRVLSPRMSHAYILHILTDPLVWGAIEGKWIEYCKYLMAFNKIFPPPKADAISIQGQQYFHKALEMLKGTNYILIGRVAAGLKGNLEILVQNTKEITEKAKKSIHGSRYTFINGHDDDTKNRVTLECNGVKYLTMYSIEDFCVPYVEARGHKCATFHVILKYMYLNKDYQSISEITALRNKFLKDNRLIGTEKEAGVYRILQVDCLGERMSEYRNFRIDALSGKKKDWRFRMGGAKE